MPISTTHEVQPGETLSLIANHYHVTLAQLLEANQQITNPNFIVIGQLIKIPDLSPVVLPPIVAGQPQVYDGIHPAPGTFTANKAAYTHPPLTNSAAHRNPNIYAQVIDQFAVGNNPRHLPGHGNTYCNIFVWDVTRAMNCEIPHWLDTHGNIAVPGAPGATEININGGVTWMHNRGIPHHGWQQVTANAAQNHANQGQPAVAMWKNPSGGHGHTAMVRPGAVNANGPASAQAGSHNFNKGHIANGFGSIHPEYFIHA